MRSNLLLPFSGQDLEDGRRGTDRGREGRTREIIAATWDRERREREGPFFAWLDAVSSLRVANPSLLPLLSLFAVLDFSKKKLKEKLRERKKYCTGGTNRREGKLFFSSLLAAAGRSRLAKKDEEVAAKKVQGKT